MSKLTVNQIRAWRDIKIYKIEVDNKGEKKVSYELAYNEDIPEIIRRHYIPKDCNHIQIKVDVVSGAVTQRTLETFLKRANL